MHAINSLAFLLKAQGQPKTAVALYAEALHARKRAHGQHHPQTLTSMSNLAIATYGIPTCRPAAIYGIPSCRPAATSALHSFASTHTIIGPISVSVSVSLCAIPMRRYHAGDVDEAIPMFKEALKGHKVHLPTLPNRTASHPALPCASSDGTVLSDLAAHRDGASLCLASATRAR